MSAGTDGRVPTLVVVGNGPVGHTFLRRLSELGGIGETVRRVVVFGEEPRTAYDRVRLTSRLGDDAASDLSFGDRAWYEQRGVELHVGDPVVSLDRAARRVTSRAGQVVAYDELVLATGSRPHVPEVAGIDRPGVFVYRTAEDAAAIRDASKRSASAIVLGGGLLGLEVAEALREGGLAVDIVEMAPVLMPRQLDTRAAALLKRLVESRGIRVHVLKRTVRVLGEERIRGLLVDDGSEIQADLLVVAAGIRPRDDLAAASGLDVGSHGGVVVDDQLSTTDAAIFAIGECARHRDVVYGLSAPGYLMADVLARRLTGEDAQFTGSDESTRLRLEGVEASLCGEFLDPGGCEVLVFETENAYRKVLLRKHRLVGAIGVGPFPELPRIQEAIEHERRIPLRDRRRFEHSGELWVAPEGVEVSAWPADAIVCGCKGISRGELSDACAAGAETVKALAERTGASTVCGSCKPLLAAIAGSPRPEPVAIPWRTLLVVSLLGVPALLAFAFGPIPYATSVQSSAYAIEALWREDFGKQITGFSLLGLTLAALLISLRKRVGFLQWGSIPVWRVVHAAVGVTTLVFLAAHTGLHTGANLNLVLFLVFLGINVLGVASGVLASLESCLDPGRARMARRWRPRLVRWHTFAFWPFPVLVAFHVLAFYYW